MRARPPSLIGAAALALAACGGPGTTVRTDETSVEGHRAEAALERALAADPGPPRTNRMAPPLIRPFAEPGVVPHDVAEDLIYEKRWHAEHARDHEAAAQQLERFEAEECRDFAASERASCPLLGPVVQIRDLPSGVRIHLARSVPVERTLARLRCHYAFARARGFSSGATCPIYLRGIEIKGSGDGTAIEIVGPSKRLAREIQKRARQQAVYDRPRS
jgi:hypothetical protein